MDKPQNGILYASTDYEKWEGHWELLEGLPKDMNRSGSMETEVVLTRIAQKLENYLFEEKATVFSYPSEIRLPGTSTGTYDSVIKPDVFVALKNEDGELSKFPEVIIEIINFSTALKDRNEKFDLYRKNGVKEYWIVSPPYKMIEVYTFDNNDLSGRFVYGDEGLLRSEVLNGFSVPMIELFDK